MDAVIYTESGQEYEMLSGILEYESPGIMVSRGIMDGSFHLEHEYDIAVVGVDGAFGMELVCKYREMYGNTLVVWITDDRYFAGVAIRTRVFGFIVRPLEETQFQEVARKIVEGDIAVWQRMPAKNSVYQTGCACEENVSGRKNRKIWKTVIS
jgi:hypothetical protein